jgi:molecular chaperone DnaJ
MIKDPCNSCSGKGVKQVRKKLKINIPAGVDSGTRLRVSGEGNAGLKGGPSGDLYVFLNVRNHPNLKRDGLTILSEVNISYLQAILGDTIEIVTVDGPTKLQIPAGTQPNCILDLDNKGVPKLGNPVARGNHQVSVKIKLPTKLSDSERNLLEELAGHYSARGPQYHYHKSGLFSKLFGNK